MNLIENVLSVAVNEIGYLEKKNARDLDDKLANAGENNYTKYSRDMVKWVGAPYAQGVAWCDIFVDWCFVTAFGLDAAKKLLGGWSAYTPTSAQYFKDMGAWYDLPFIGDVIFFKNSKRICHTGIVYRVLEDEIYTIEGNTSVKDGLVENGGGVACKIYKMNYKKIAGYGRPQYNAFLE